MKVNNTVYRLNMVYSCNIGQYGQVPASLLLKLSLLKRKSNDACQAYIHNPIRGSCGYTSNLASFYHQVTFQILCPNRSCLNILWSSVWAMSAVGPRSFLGR